ncbi:MAG: trypsin-like serine protease [Halieaceae bacterium]|nr:trypsin-like serine protease [Halieaceae bacterium]
MQPLPIMLMLLGAVAACKPLPADSWVAKPAPAPAPTARAPTPIAPTTSSPPAGVIGIAAPEARVLENAYGNEDRQFVTSAKFPWSTVGKLSTQCTATLIDRRLIITASHCLFDSQGKWKANDIYFFPNLVSGQARDRARITYAWTGSLTPFAQTATLQDDWAIGLIDADLGDRYSWVGVRNYLAVPGDSVTLTGYSQDLRGGDTATAHVDCKVRGYVNGQLAHDCDMTKGASGGPLWSRTSGDVYIVGINSLMHMDGGRQHLANYDDRYPNGAVAATRFVETVVWAVANY